MPAYRLCAQPPSPRPASQADADRPRRAGAAHARRSPREQRRRSQRARRSSARIYLRRAPGERASPCVGGRRARPPDIGLARRDCDAAAAAPGAPNINRRAAQRGRNVARNTESSPSWTTCLPWPPVASDAGKASSLAPVHPPRCQPIIHAIPSRKHRALCRRERPLPIRNLLRALHV